MMQWIVKFGLAVFCLLAALVPPAVAGPSVEEMAAQMLMVGFRGMEAGPEAPIVRHIKAGCVGNVILFGRDLTKGAGPGRNIRSPEQLKALSAGLKAAVPADMPLWVALDQEGGRVQRLRPSQGFDEDYPSAGTLGASDDVALTRAVGERMGRELAELGIDVDFAPVADVNVNPESPAIGALGRSFGADPEAVARHAAAFSEGLRAAGIIPCLKHFPGHGSAAADTHIGAADVTHTWREEELIPYRRAVASGWRGMIMTSHIFNAALDPALPASLSERIVTGLLRESLGWDGIVVTDDLDMGALTRSYSLEERILLAVSAGSDLLIFAQNRKDMDFDPDLPRRAHETLVRLVKEGRIPEGRLRESWGRIAKMKRGAGRAPK